ncbi:MAG: phosphatase PAP2 family protein [Gammaproteobacteria bacterium]
MTAPICIAIVVWLLAAHCGQRALQWCLVFGAAMAVVIVSKLAFIGWGIGIRSLDFIGFSGHAARVGAIYPVAAYLLCREARPPVRWAAVIGASLLALLVAVSRVKVLSHSPAEAAAGLALGLAAAGAFIALMRGTRRFTPNPWLVGITVLVLVLQTRVVRGDGRPFDSHVFLTGVALNLSGHDSPYVRWSWQRLPHPYTPPCPVE